VMGIFTKDETVRVNPPMDTVIESGDRVIAISEDDDTLRLTEKPAPAIKQEHIRRSNVTKGAPERSLLLGWNRKAETIVRELDNFVPDGSEITIVTEADLVESLAHASDLRQRVNHHRGNTTGRAMLDQLNVTTYDHIILLSDEEIDVQESDAKTLITLLHLRNIAEESGRDLSIVSEMRDIRNRALAEVARADDFIVSDKLVSLMLSQLSENKHLDMVFQDLFRPEGSEIYLKPIGDYVAPCVPLDFYTLLEAAAERGETAIGYRIAALTGDSERGYGVKCNPIKSEVVTFAEADRIIVLAED